MLIQDVCPKHPGVCQAMRSVGGGQFYKDYLLKVSFTGIQSNLKESEEILNSFQKCRYSFVIKLI